MPITITDPQTVELLKSLAKPRLSVDWIDIASKVTGFLSVLVAISALILGHHWSTANDEKKRKLEYVEKQLRELYGPLMGALAQIQHLSKYLNEVDMARSSYVSKKLEEIRGLPRDQRESLLSEIDKDGSAEFNYNLAALKEEVFPLYTTLRDTFRDNFGLADEDVRRHWPNLVKFIDSWNRTLQAKHNPEISHVYRVSERRLQPLFALLEWHFETLQRRLSSGNPDLPSLPPPTQPPESDQMDKPLLLELINGYSFYLGNIDPARVKEFTSVLQLSHDEHPKGRDEYLFTLTTEDGDYRDLHVKVLHAKDDHGRSCLELTLGFWSGA